MFFDSISNIVFRVGNQSILTLNAIGVNTNFIQVNDGIQSTNYSSNTGFNIDSQGIINCETVYERNPRNDLPIGTIIMFNGLQEDIPENWHICDGSVYDEEGNTTPNLIDRFIKGGMTAGETGGQSKMTLTHEMLPPHIHTFKNYLIQVNGNDEINIGTITY